MKKSKVQWQFGAVGLMAIMLFACESQPTVQTSEEPKTPPNFTLVQDELLDYYNSGEYIKQLNAVAQEALDYLETVTVEPGKSVLVLDIDDTSISNGKVLTETRFCKNDEWGKWLLKAEAPALASVHQVYEKALAKGVEVVFITARPNDLEEVTVKNLVFADYATYDTLIMKVKGKEYPSSAAFKTGIRKALTEAGKDIILNIGDQESDVSGGFAKKAFKLPNPFYFTE